MTVTKTELANIAGTITAAITLPITWVMLAIITVALSPLLLFWCIDHKMNWPNGWIR